MQTSLLILPSDPERPHGRKTFPGQERINRGSLNLFAPFPAALCATLSKKTPKECGSSPLSALSHTKDFLSNPNPEEEKAIQSTFDSLAPGNHPSALAEGSLSPSLSFPRTDIPSPEESHTYGGAFVTKRGKYINQESSATREFPTRGRRRVPVAFRLQHGEGLKNVKNASAAHQNIQVVNITPAYLDPTNIPTPRVGLRCVSHISSGPSQMQEVLEYKGASEQLRGKTLQVPVGKAVAKWQKSMPPSPGSPQKFLQAVKNRCAERAKGITQFYVLLCRNLIGGSTPSTPRVQASRLWEIDVPLTPSTLTLLRCRDQLVSLTSISISLTELATLIWGGVALVEQNDRNEEDEELKNRLVSYVDFSNAFGE